MFNPKRLILARNRKGYTAKQLADHAGVTSVHLSRIENGRAENIEDVTIDALAKALDFPREFFYGDDVDTPTKDTASFRSLSAMTARERNAALSAGSFAYLINDWVESKFNLPSLEILDLSNEREPEAASRTLRNFWGLGEKPIGNVIKLLESKGIRVFSLSENTKNVDAFSCWRNGTPYIFLNTFKTAEHSRFDAAHELGHLVLHRHGATQGREAEKEANKFASHFLMPATDLMAHLPLTTSLNFLIKSKKRWGVSLAALAYRLHKTGIISDWQYRTFCIQINKKYGIKEPEGLDRETSFIWDYVFKELWKDKKNRAKIAKELSIPEEQFNNLTFSNVTNKPSDRDNISTLKLV